MGKFSEPNLNPPKIEQYFEYRNTTRRGSEPAPPDAAKALRGTNTIEEIREATEARRAQSASWAKRPTTPRGDTKMISGKIISVNDIAGCSRFRLA